MKNSNMKKRMKKMMLQRLWLKRIPGTINRPINKTYKLHAIVAL
jgi:hypothetical protein